jgi:hypothetical protein
MKPPSAVALSAAALALLVSASRAQDPAAMAEPSRAVATDFANRLGAELKRELSSGGPESAIKVCRQVAPQIAGELSLARGWKVSRVSLKPRNPMLGTPDPWEQQVLASFDERAAKGEDVAKMEAADIVQEPQGRCYRYMKALPMAPLCVQCHGSADAIPAGVKAQLASQYPKDTATGYAPGQVRGAITIKRPL